MNPEEKALKLWVDINEVYNVEDDLTGGETDSCVDLIAKSFQSYEDRIEKLRTALEYYSEEVAEGWVFDVGFRAIKALEEDNKKYK